MQTLTDFLRTMRTKIFISLILTSLLLLSSCQLDDTTKTLSSIEDGVWSVTKVSFVGENEPVNGFSAGYYVFEKGVLLCYFQNESAYGPDAPYEYTEHTYEYKPEKHRLYCTDSTGTDIYKVKYLSKHYLVLEEGNLHYRMKKITWEEFKKTDHYKKAQPWAPK